MKLLKSNFLLNSILVFFIYLTYIWIDSFYLATRNEDFSKYYDYINYFLGLDVDIDYGQGALYYFLISIFIKQKIEIVDFFNSDYIISSAVHKANLIFFVISLIGFYKLLKLKKFEKLTIYLSLIILIFLPQSIYLRAVMKPEIVAFSFLPWIVFFIEKFLVSKNIKYLYSIIPFLSLSLISKGSIAGMLLIYLLFAYGYNIKDIKFLKLISLITTLSLVFCLLQYENYLLTGKYILERPYDLEYDFKADPNVIYNFSILEIFKEPFYDFNQNGSNIHSNSIPNILILDSFGDFFNQLFDSQTNYFSQYRKNIFDNNLEVFFTPDRVINYRGPFNNFLKYNLNYLRKILSIVLSILFYVLILRESLRDKNLKKFYLAPFVGIFILYLNSLGIPFNNFNPIKGDTFKTFYFSFLFSLSFIFIVAKYLKNVSFLKIFFLFIYIISIFFISGHPKQNNQLLSEHLLSINQHSLFCNINNKLIFENNIINKVFPSGNVNNLKSDCKPVKNVSNFYKIDNEDRKRFDDENLSRCTDSNKKILNNQDIILSSNSEICRIYTFEQLQSQQALFKYKNLIFTLILFISTLVLIVKELFLEINVFKKY